MLFHRITRIGLAALLITLAIIPLHSAFAIEAISPFESVSAYCDYGVFKLSGQQTGGAPLYATEIPTFRVDVWDNGTLLGSVQFDWSVIVDYTGEVPFSQMPTGDTVLFKLWVLNVGPFAPNLDAIASEGAWIFMGQQAAPVDCTPDVPGCDTRIAMTADAAVGLFVADAMAYWEPAAGSGINITLPAGNTAWVLGMDASGDFYKIVWVCDCLWVAANTMGPNPDAAWNSTPLPMTVIE